MGENTSGERSDIKEGSNDGGRREGSEYEDERGSKKAEKVTIVLYSSTQFPSLPSIPYHIIDK